MRLPRTSLDHPTSTNGRNIAHLFVDHHLGWQEIGSAQPYLPLAGLGRGTVTEGDWSMAAPAGWGCLFLQRRAGLKRFDFPRLLPSRGLSVGTNRRQTFAMAAFRPDGDAVLLADSARATGQPYARLLSTSDGRPLGVPMTDCDSRPKFSPSGRLLALSTFDDTRKEASLIVRVYDARTGQPRGPAWSVPAYMHALEFSPDERRLAIGHVRGAIVVDVEGNAPPTNLVQPGPITKLRFNRDGTRLAMAGRSGWGGSQPGVQGWVVSTGKPLGKRLPMNEAPLLLAGESSDEFLTLDLQDGRLRRWDFRGSPGTDIGPLPSWPGTLRAQDGVVFDPLRRRLAIGTPHGMIHRWDLGAPSRTEPAADFRESVRDLSYSADGRWLAASGDDGVAALFDALSGKRVGPLLTHGSPLLAMAFRADGHELQTVTADGNCRHWQVGGPQPLDGAQWKTLIEAATGLRLDGDAVVALNVADYERRNAEARQLETPPFQPEPILRWDREELFRAEAAGRWNSARWHLDRWIAQEPNDWLPWARRARISALEENPKSALADLKRATELAPVEVDHWRRHEAVFDKVVGKKLPVLEP